MRHAVLVLALVGALAACSKDDSGSGAPPPPGCDRIAMDGTCYVDPAATPTTCGNDFGTWLTGGCPSTDLVGICVTPGRVEYYYSSWYTSYWAGQACGTSGGTFTPMGALVTAWCDARSTIGVCADLAGTESDMAAASSTWSFMCAIYGGTWYTDGSCPTAGRTATCSILDAGVEVREGFYFPTTSSDAAACANDGGAWSPN